jgi:hypothetical protein
VSRVAATVLAAGLLTLALAGYAVANHVDSMYKTANFNIDCFDGTLAGGGIFCQTDNAGLTVWREGSIPAGSERTNVGGVLADEFRPTDLSVTFVKSPVYSGDAETDIIYQKGDVPSGTAAITWCNDAVSDLQCDQHYNRYDTFIDKNIACHESGHAVGLTHGQQASPKLSDSDNSLGCLQVLTQPPTLDAHNKQLINDTY